LSVAGVLDLIGEKNKPPSIPGIQIADIAGGGMYAAIGILMALHSRERSGKGQYIDISMTDGSFSLLSIALSLLQITGQPVKRADSFLSHRYACYNTYETADNRYLSIGAVENRFWKNLCEHFKVQEYISLQYDDERRHEIINFMRKRFKQKTLDAWEEELSSLDICWGPVRSLAEAFDSTLFKERDMVVETKDKEGKDIKLLGVPIKMSDTPAGVHKLSPEFGENTNNILHELGYSDEQIHGLSEEGVI